MLRKYKSYQVSLLRLCNLADAHLRRLAKVCPFSKERVTVFYFALSDHLIVHYKYSSLLKYVGVSSSFHFLASLSISVFEKGMTVHLSLEMDSSNFLGKLTTPVA